MALVLAEAFFLSYCDFLKTNSDSYDKNIKTRIIVTSQDNCIRVDPQKLLGKA